MAFEGAGPSWAWTWSGDGVGGDLGEREAEE
jgi:hypothetical protein